MPHRLQNVKLSWCASLRLRCTICKLSKPAVWQHSLPCRSFEEPVGSPLNQQQRRTTGFVRSSFWLCSHLLEQSPTMIGLTNKPSQARSLIWNPAVTHCIQQLELMGRWDTYLAQSPPDRLQNVHLSWMRIWCVCTRSFLLQHPILQTGT